MEGWSGFGLECAHTWVTVLGVGAWELEGSVWGCLLILAICLWGPHSGGTQGRERRQLGL